MRSLGKRGINTVLGVDGTSTSEATSRYCGETVPLEFTREDFTAYKEALLELAARPDVRTILPVWEETVFALSRYYQEFADHVDLAVPDFERLRNVHDRVRLVEAAERAGVPVPETKLLTDVEEWDRKLLVKSRYNLLASEYVDSYPPNRTGTADLVEHLREGEKPDVDRLVAEMDHVPIVQEFVPWTDEYMVGAICEHGEPLATIQLHQVREDSYTGGGGVYRRSIYDPELDDVVCDLLAELDWHGLACVEYMEDAETGEFKLTEINPRIWQSIGPTVRAGIDFPYYYWLLAVGRPDLIDPDYETGVGSHLLKGEVAHLKSIRNDDSPYVERPNLYAAMGDVALSCLREPRFDMLRFDDPGPFVHGVQSGLRRRIESRRAE
ncbi:carboxylate--amine ligase [Halorussus halobius]|uniref:carboxylate--amine ligase n=1 Tax=Halorussus halobius TaxID=1710537 RepID=UPI001B2FE36C|nr:carboxylate--amine ligase [Halorussus halobius]